MMKKIALEPGFDVKLSDNLSNDIKNDPESLPPAVQAQVFQKKISDIYLRKPLDGGFQAKREKQRRTDITNAFQTMKTAIKFGVQSRDYATGRNSRAIRIREVDMAVDVIRRELDESMVVHGQEIFLEPASIESVLRSKTSQGSGLVALANACFILSKYVQERNPKYESLSISDNREVFSPLEACRKGYALDYLEGIKDFGGIEYVERVRSNTSEKLIFVLQRNKSRLEKKDFILQQAREKCEIIGNAVSDMRTKGIREIEFQLSQLTINKHSQKLDIEKNHIEALEACITKFYISSSSDEKNLLAGCPLLRKILATGGSSGAAGWNLWAEREHRPEDLLYPPLTASASVMESLLRPAKNSNIPVYEAKNRPNGWSFLEFDLVGSGGSGRVFVAHRIAANTGHIEIFDGHGDLWIVLIVDKDPHQGAQPGRYMEKYKMDIKRRFDQWASIGLTDPFVRKP